MKEYMSKIESVCQEIKKQYVNIAFVSTGVGTFGFNSRSLDNPLSNILYKSRDIYLIMEDIYSTQ